MIKYILQQAQDSPIIQKLLGSKEVPPGRYNRVSGVGQDSKKRKFGYTEETDNELGITRETRPTDTLFFFHGPRGSELFTSPHKPRPVQADQMSPEMWKRYNEHMDALKQSWMDNPSIR